jgi:hypothetical protein
METLRRPPPKIGQSQNESRRMTVPQPFQYQGSQRALALLIRQCLRISTTRLTLTANLTTSVYG